MRSFAALWITLMFATSVSAAERGGPTEPRVPAMYGEGVILTSNGTALAARETAGPDTFALYGGPDEPAEGKFQLADRITPDWGGGNGLPGGYGGGPDAWRPVDLTDEAVYWHQSTFNAATLNDNGAGNQALWCGVDVGDPVGASWENLPGYGNGWRDAILYESASVADNTVGQTVNLDFFFHHDTEPGYDYFIVEYDSAGTWNTVLAIDGTNADSSGFQAPGVQFSAVQTAPIRYTGDDYGGETGDQIRIRLTVRSDGAYSDEDGMWMSQAGAVQIDDITLSSTIDLAPVSEDFEGPGPYLLRNDRGPFAGDFADVYEAITDIDVCRDNRTPVVGFVDTGQIIRNGPGVNGATHIPGGSTSPGINYGVPGNYVVNYTGGLSFGEVDLRNEIWSPEILWDLPGSEDDDPEVVGAFIRWTQWTHLPASNGFVFLWHVRSAQPGSPFSTWKDRNFWWWPGGARWANYRQDVSDLLQQDPERVQMALACWDYASIWAFAGTAATPSPIFDNAAFYKYRMGGPAFATRTIDTANDGFPINGSIDVSSASSRDALDIPFNMARDVNSGDIVNGPGDSVIVDVVAKIPGTAVTDIRMVWALQTNAVFEDALRAAPARAKDANVVAGSAGTVWSGEVVADTSTTSAGAVIRDRFFVDLPDVDFMYPGDILHYYIQATDSDGRVTTLPGNTDGFSDFTPNSAYARAWTVRGLPTISDTAGTQPSILVWNDFGRRGGENEWLTSFRLLGYAEGVDYDTYTTQGPTSGVSNGLGSAGAHGANADQLAGYNHMFYFAGNLSTFLLSNGSNVGNNDKGDDIDVMEQWHAKAGVRNVAYFGDYIADAMVSDSAEAFAYVGATMGVAYGDDDVRDVIGGQTAPLVVPNAAGPYAAIFGTEYVTYGGCLSLNQFDQIQPASGAVAGHLFTNPSGVPYPPSPDPASGGVASVIHPTPGGFDVTFPYASFFIYDVRSRAVSLSARTQLFAEILDLFEAPESVLPPVAAPQAMAVALSTSPNPFNPVTSVKFTAPIGSRGSVKIYNLRGELVRTLHSGEFHTQEFTWDGTDTRGASVANGVYVIHARSEGQKFNAKVALVK